MYPGEVLLDGLSFFLPFKDTLAFLRTSFFLPLEGELAIELLNPYGALLLVFALFPLNIDMQDFAPTLVRSDGDFRGLFLVLLLLDRRMLNSLWLFRCRVSEIRSREEASESA